MNSPLNFLPKTIFWCFCLVYLSTPFVKGQLGASVYLQFTNNCAYDAEVTIYHTIMGNNDTLSNTTDRNQQSSQGTSSLSGLSVTLCDGSQFDCAGRVNNGSVVYHYNYSYVFPASSNQVYYSGDSTITIPYPILVSNTRTLNLQCPPVSPTANAAATSGSYGVGQSLATVFLALVMTWALMNQGDILRVTDR